jgi:hypothetical protein
MGGENRTFFLGGEIAEADYTSLGHLCGKAKVKYRRSDRKSS